MRSVYVGCQDEGCYYCGWGNIFVDSTVVGINPSGGREVEAHAPYGDFGSVVGIGRCSAGCWRVTDLLLRSKKYRASVWDL